MPRDNPWGVASHTRDCNISLTNNDSRIVGNSAGSSTYNAGFSATAKVSSSTTQGASFTVGLSYKGAGATVGGGGAPVTLGSGIMARPLTCQTATSGGGGDCEVSTSTNSYSSVNMTGSGNVGSPASMNVAIHNFTITLVFQGRCTVCNTEEVESVDIP